MENNETVTTVNNPNGEVKTDINLEDTVELFKVIEEVKGEING